MQKETLRRGVFLGLGETLFCLNLFSGKIVKFSKNYFKRPRITYDENEASENVTLLCNVELVNVSTWTNVTYHVEWLRDGVFLRNESLCPPPSSSVVNKNPCPVETQLIARLGQEYYGYGESVSSVLHLSEKI